MNAYESLGFRSVSLLEEGAQRPKFQLNADGFK